MKGSILFVLNDEERLPSKESSDILPMLSLPAWMAINRKSAVVRASQPEFLSVVAIGCLVVASAILPLAVEGEYRYERDSITSEETDVPNEEIQVGSVFGMELLICFSFSF